MIEQLCCFIVKPRLSVQNLSPCLADKREGKPGEFSTMVQYVKVLEKTPQNAHPMCYCHQLRNQEDARMAFWRAAKAHCDIMA